MSDEKPQVGRTTAFERIDMRPYLVEYSGVCVVVAENESGASDAARDAVIDEPDAAGLLIGCVETLDSIEQLPKPWTKGSLPFGTDLDDRTIAEWLSARPRDDD